MLAIVCPGQGSQTPGFLAPWLEVPGFADRLEQMSQAAQMDLRAHGTVSDAETIKDTAVAQPLIVASGLAALPALLGEQLLQDVAGVVSGHSVGEFTAAGAAAVVTPQEAVVLVRERGRAMAAASAVTPTGMSAVLGGDQDEVVAALEAKGITPANMNGGGQIVAAGTLEQLAALREDPPAKAKIIPLQVAGAFHTHHMAPAVETLRTAAADVTPREAAVAIATNGDGSAIRAGREVLDRMVAQVANPVRWDRVMETLLAMGVTGLIELPPAGTLVGLAKRGMKGVASVALKTPDDLDAAKALVADHAGASV